MYIVWWPLVCSHVCKSGPQLLSGTSWKQQQALNLGLAAKGVMLINEVNRLLIYMWVNFAYKQHSKCAVVCVPVSFIFLLPVVCLTFKKIRFRLILNRRLYFLLENQPALRIYVLTRNEKKWCVLLLTSLSAFLLNCQYAACLLDFITTAVLGCVVWSVDENVGLIHKSRRGGVLQTITPSTIWCTIF